MNYKEREKITQAFFQKIKELYGHEETDYDTMQCIAMKAIACHYEISDKILLCLSNPALGGDRAWVLHDALRDGVPINVVEIIADLRYTKHQMFDITQIFKRGVTPEQAALFLNPEFNGSCMEEIAKGFWDGLSFEDVSLYANPAFSCAQMMEIHSGLLTLPRDKVLLFCDPKLHFIQMTQIREGLLQGKEEIEVSSYEDAKQAWDTYAEAFMKAFVDEWCKTDHKGLIDANETGKKAAKIADQALDGLRSAE